MSPSRRDILKAIPAFFVAEQAVGILGRGIPQGGTPSPPSGLATYNFTSTGWATFGLALDEGLATGGVKVGSLTTQTDVLRTWGDGSIRHCLVTVNIASTGNLNIVDDVHESGTITPTWPSASVAMIVGGVTYTATLPSFTAADSYVSGQHLRECKVITLFTGGSGTAASNYIECIWYVRSYSGGEHEISVVLKNGNVEAANANRVVMTSLIVTISGSPVYTFTAVAGANTLTLPGASRTITSNSHGLITGDTIQLTTGPQSGECAFIVPAVTTNTADMYQYSGDGADGTYGFSTSQTAQSWQRVLCLYFGTAYMVGRFAVSGFSASTYTPDLTPFQDSYAIIEFGSGISNDTYDDSGRSYAIPGVGSIQLPMAGATSDEQLGFYPRWVAVWQEHKTQNQWNHMLTMADRCMTINGRYVKSDGSIFRHRDVGWANFVLRSDAGADGPDNAMAGAGICYEFDPAHHGSHFYVPYVMTGRREYLDSMKELETFMGQSYNFPFFDDFENHREQGRGGASVFLGASFGGARGWAWNLRGWSDAAWIIPDAETADQSYFVDVITDNCEWAETYAAELAADTNDVIGWAGTGTENYFSVLDPYTQAIDSFPYMQSYLSFGVQRCKQHEFMVTSALRDMLGLQAWQLYDSDPDYPKEWGLPYTMSLGRQQYARLKAVPISNPATLEFVGSHALTSGDSITIAGSNTTPSINGTHTVTVTDLSHVTIPVNVTAAGTPYASPDGNLIVATVSAMPCPGGSVMTNNGGATTPFVYYTSWAQIFETIQNNWGGNTGPPGSGTIYAPQEYFLLQCAQAAGESGATAALAWVLGNWSHAANGAFSMARF